MYVYMKIESLKNTFRASPRLASIHEFLFLHRFVFRPGPLELIWLVEGFNLDINAVT